MNEFRQIAFKAAKLAGQSLLKNYKKLGSSDIHKKGKHDLITKADLEANRIIIKTIKRRFPKHDFLSEETGLEDNPDAYRWVIDPLDGTTNYTVRNPLFCTAIALVNKGEIILSIINAPYLGEFYFSQRGKGSYLNSKKIRTSKVKSLGNSLVMISRSHHRQSHKNFITIQKKLEYRVQNIRSYGSSALDLAYVADGRAEGCALVPPATSLWDSLAGISLIRESGGRVTDFNGKEWTFKSLGVLASNGVIHKKLLSLVK